MRHGAESPRPIVPDTCGFYGVVRSLIVGSNPTLTSGRSVSSAGRAIHNPKKWTCHWFESFTDLFFLNLCYEKILIVTFVLVPFIFDCLDWFRFI